MKICREPFENIEISTTRDAFLCCAMHLKKQDIGNISLASFEEVWNSSAAIAFREKILCGDYSLCKQFGCYNCNSMEATFVQKTDSMLPKMEEYPKFVKLMHDNECNVNCIICRDSIIRRTPEELKELNSQIDSVFLPILKNAEIVVLNSSGDPFASRHNLELIKKIIRKYPKIKFDIHSNGIIATEKLLKKMGLVHRLNKIVISVHAATKETYDKIVLHGNYDQLMKNMRYYSYLSASGKLLVLDICFVVNSLNYHEMPQFLEYAKSIGANAFFWEYRVQGFKEHKNYDELAIHLPQHKDHHKLLEVLKNSCFDGLGYEPLHPQLRQLKMQAIG